MLNKACAAALLVAGIVGNAAEPVIWKGEVPDALTSASGRKIATVQEWETIRKPELLELFSREVYGRSPRAPGKAEFRLLERSEDALDGKAIRIQGDVTIPGADADLSAEKREETGAGFLGDEFQGQSGAQ